MPIVSDPGNILVKKLIENDLPFTIVPGANAGLSALILSGFDASKFAFFGFLSEKNKILKTQLNDIKNFEGTRIVYSSKYNINKDLQNLHSCLGAVNVAIVSEITKIHENVNIQSLPYSIEEPKGEYVIVIEYVNKSKICPNDTEILDELKDLLRSIDKSTAMKMLKEKYNISKSYIYNLYEKSKLK